MSEKRDYRALDHRTLEFLRTRAVECLVQEGETPNDVARILGVPVQDVYKWRKMYERGGWEELKAKPIPGRPRKLDDKQAQCIGKIVRAQTPQAWMFPLALWTRATIALLITCLFRATLCLASVGNLLARIRFTCQRPLRRAREQNQQRVREWITTTFPALLRRAKEEGAQVFFMDEAGVRSDYHSGTTWAPIGQTPVVATTGKRFSWNMLAAISSRGFIRFRVDDQRLNSWTFIAFLRHLLSRIKRKILLIADNHSAHHSAQTRAFLATVSKRLELHFLPPYAQEHNPTELLWNQVKNHEIGRTALYDAADMKNKLVASLLALAQAPEKITSFFKAHGTRYALAPSLAA